MRTVAAEVFTESRHEKIEQRSKGALYIESKKIDLLLGTLACFFIPFKITLCYVALIPLILSELLFFRKEISETLRKTESLQILALFFITTSITSLFGINITRSVQHLGTLFFFPFTILCFYRLTQKYNVDHFLKAFLIGLSVACIMQLIEFLNPAINTRFLGPVSQSGQIALLIIPLLCYYTNDLRNNFQKNMLSILAMLPILIGFVCNLKRGPWFGVFLGALLFCILHYRKLIILFFIVPASIFLIEPIRERILLSEAHFFIPGGRYAIWEIGQELLLKYPLGIGFENSGFLRAFSNDIPNQLKHFHNNFLNIAVETGWLGLGLFWLWLLSFFRSIIQYSGPSMKLSHAIGCGLLAWLIAGFVEYNFGDSAVVTVAYILIGMQLGISAVAHQHNQS